MLVGFGQFAFHWLAFFPQVRIQALGIFHQFQDIYAHAKFKNPTTTHSGILVMVQRRRKKERCLIPKIVAYLSCTAGCTHFAQNLTQQPPPGKKRYKTST
jgi:hypothetical protein